MSVEERSKITLEQRAAALMTVIEIEKRLTPKRAQELIIESFQLLIEDCAKKVDELRRRGVVDGIGDAIRALAAPTEESATLIINAKETR